MLTSHGENVEKNVNDVTSLFNDAITTGDRKALCEWLKQKKNTVLLDVFEDICNEFELIDPEKGPSRSTRTTIYCCLKSKLNQFRFI